MISHKWNGFNTERYLEVQVKKILERTGLFDKLYLEFGGKLRYDNHATRVLPGFALDTKMRMLQQVGESIEIIHCISAQKIKGARSGGTARAAKWEWIPNYVVEAVRRRCPWVLEES